MAYKVLVDDNFHYMDESERYELGVFPTLDAAIEASQEIVDEYLRSAYQPGMTTEALLTSGVLFSARDYARRRCEELCLPKDGRDTDG